MSDPNRRPGHRDSDWSPREVYVLKAMWRTADSLAVISQRLGRSLHAIHAKATKLGLGPFVTPASKIIHAPGLTWAERQRRHMLLVRNLRHRQGLGFTDPVMLRASSCPIGAPLRSIEPATAALIQQFLERRA